jgi:hypothetical protein
LPSPLAPGGGQALVHRPDLARPAIRPGTTRQDGERWGRVPHGLVLGGEIGGEIGGDLAGAVVAPVIYKDDAEVAGVVLAEQSRQCDREYRGLVPGRDHCHDLRPVRPVAD